MSFQEFQIWFAAWVVFFAAAVLGIAPLASPVLLVALISSILVVFVFDKNKDFLKHAPFLFFLFMAFTGYLLLNTLWAFDIKMALAKSLLVGFLALSCLVTTHYFSKLSKAEIWPVARGIVIGLLIALIWLLVELLSNEFLIKILFSKGSVFDAHDKQEELVLWRLNKSISVVNIVFWPSLIIATLWPQKNLRFPLIISLLCGMAAVTFLSESESAKFALVFGGLTFFFVTYRPQLIHRVAMTLWGIATLLVIPLVLIAYQFGLQNTTWLPPSAKDRMHIWHYTILKIPENPIGGIGIRSSRGKLADPKQVINAPKQQGFYDRPGWHPHNIFLQTWYELGAIGAGFLFVIGLLLLRRIKRYSEPIQPYAYATFAASTSIAAFGYGMWQSWLMVGYTWAVFFLIIAERYGKHSKTSSSNL